MGKFGEELIESMQQAAANAGGRKVSGRARDYSEDSRREGDPESITYVATPLRRIVSNSTSDAENSEQGRRAPDAPAAAYLLAIQRRPKEVMEAVASRSLTYLRFVRA